MKKTQGDTNYHCTVYGNNDETLLENLLKLKFVKKFEKLQVAVIFDIFMVLTLL